MPFGTQYNGGHTAHSIPIFLNVYDLSPLNENVLDHIGCSVLHTGVEISGREYTFAGGSGVFEGEVRSAPPAVYKQSVELGTFAGTQSEVMLAIDDLKGSFGPSDYNILSRNCNHFSDALCRSLLGRSIPAWVNRAAYFGSFFECCFPKAALAGGGEPGGSGTNNPSADGGGVGSSSFHVFAPRGRTPATPSARTASTATTKTSWGSGGQTLGSASLEGESESESLLDRRERALKRFEKSA